MKQTDKTLKKQAWTWMILLFWLALWQIAAAAVGNRILLVGPVDVLGALLSLLPDPDFWLSVATSFGKISTGFLTAFFSGILIGWLAFAVPVLQDFLAPVIAFMKSVPVASFVILALIWMGSRNLSVFIAFLVVFPMIYVNTIAGLKSTDHELLEMAQIFSISGWRKIRCLYWPALLPYLTSSCKTALGMSWKSGIAAEVIGVPDHTIGEQLYLSKIYLSTAELFAWTLVIILASALFEQLFLALLGRTGTGKLFLCERKKHGPAIHPSARFSDGSSAVPGQAGSASLPEHAAEPASEAPLPSPSLTVSGLSKSFGELKVLQQIDLKLQAGPPYCLMGPSGSGKTTFFRILMGLETADSGSFRLQDGISHDKAALGLRLAAVFQENRLCEDFSPIDNIRLAVPELSRKQAAAELSRILPSECLNRPVSTLSGGMKRRTAIARALLSPAHILLMDEPFTGLDEETKQIVIRYIQEKTAGKLLILSTHQEEDITLLHAVSLDFHFLPC